MDSVIAAHSDVAATGGIAPFVQARGWPAFRAIEASLFARVMRRHTRGAVIACGGGIVECPTAVAAMTAWSARVAAGEGYDKVLGRFDDVADVTASSISRDDAVVVSLEVISPPPLVIHLRRSEPDLDRYLSSDASSRPSLVGDKPIDDSDSKGVSEHVAVLRRRLPVYQAVSSAEFFLTPANGDAAWATAVTAASSNSTARASAHASTTTSSPMAPTGVAWNAADWRRVTAEWVAFSMGRLGIFGTTVTAPIVQPPILREGSFMFCLTVGDLTKPYPEPSASITAAGGGGGGHLTGSGGVGPAGAAAGVEMPRPPVLWPVPSAGSQRVAEESAAHARVSAERAKQRVMLKAARIMPSEPVPSPALIETSDADSVVHVPAPATATAIAESASAAVSVAADGIAGFPFPLAAAAHGSDVVELRADLLSVLPPVNITGASPAPETNQWISFLHSQLQVIRAAVPDMPVLFTLRSAREGGRFAGSEAAYTAALSAAIRLGFDYVDIEARWTLTTRARLAAQATSLGTRIISSTHFASIASPSVGAMGIATDLNWLVRTAVKDGLDLDGWPVEFVKVVASARDHADSAVVSAAAGSVLPKHSHIPYGLANRLDEATERALERRKPQGGALAISDAYNLARLESVLRASIAAGRAATGSGSASSTSSTSTSSSSLYDRFTPRAVPGVIALAMGSEGTASRVLCDTLCPVTSSILPFAAAPGQMSAEAVQQVSMHL